MFKKKEVKPEDIKSEDIAKDIEKSLYGRDISKSNAFAKLATFLMLFFMYIYLSISMENPVIKVIIIFFGLVILILLLQGAVIPAFKKKQKKSLLEN